MKKPIILSAIALLTVCTVKTARADALPPIQTLRQYTVEFSSSVSAILSETTQFQKIETIALPATGPFGSCQAEVKTASILSHFGIPQTLTCQSRSNCYFHPVAQCTLSFIDGQDLTSENIAKITRVEKFGLKD